MKGVDREKGAFQGPLSPCPLAQTPSWPWPSPRLLPCRLHLQVGLACQVGWEKGHWGGRREEGSKDGRGRERWGAGDAMPCPGPLPLARHFRLIFLGLPEELGSGVGAPRWLCSSQRTESKQRM